MKEIKLHNWEIEALAYKRKSSFRIPLNIQPVKDMEGMWHWMDCHWMNDGLGVPQSGIKDYCPIQIGDVLVVQNTGFCLRVKDLRIERLWDITDEAAEKEGCQGVFSGTGETMGSGWVASPVDVYRRRWNPFVSMAERQWKFIFTDKDSDYNWDANPWVLVVEFEAAGKEKAEPVGSCQYCFGKTRMAFRCDVRILRNDGITEDVPVPVLHCPYCGRLLRTEV